MHSLREIKGIGEKTEALFEKLGVFSQEDLIRYYPRAYESFEPPSGCGSVTGGRINAVRGIVRSAPSVRSFGRNTVTMLFIKDEGGSLQINWFHMPYLRSKLTPGSEFVFRGYVTEKGRRTIMEHPRIYTPEEYEKLSGALLPVYPLTDGISTQTLRKTVAACLEALPVPEEYYPVPFLTGHRLAGLTEALRGIHFPADRDELYSARRRLVFDEFFFFILGVSSLKNQTAAGRSDYPMKASPVTDRVIDSLPYALTGGQKEVWKDLAADLTADKPMSRLIQGDVGSGKTILAFLAMIMTGANGFQSVLMAPTEVLARQHYSALKELLARSGMEDDGVVLLTGSVPQAQKRELYSRIENGRANMIIGTHALIQEKVHFQNAALVITDEQHRFGVRQRAMLSSGEKTPNVLVMSATPIPRTLAMILYGDLDISTLREMPVSRVRIKTAIVGKSGRDAAFRFFRKEIGQGHQIYVICPMVSPSEEIDAENVTDYAVMLRREMGRDIHVDVLHGQMPSKEKNAVMEDFAAGKTDILVSTTVVEVGVNVPNATVILVENAERFGLAQLHQLRGRVGRGAAQSYCIFVYGGDQEEIPERLRILQNSADGFEIAEEDLRLRGPGDLLGIRQSGEAYFAIADLYADRDILMEAYHAAGELEADGSGFVPDAYFRIKDELALRVSKQIDHISL